MKLGNNPSIVLVGSVSSSRVVLDTLVSHGFDLKGVLGVAPNRSANISGYVDLGPFAAQYGIPFFHFVNVNSVDVINKIKEWNPDIIFVIGLSQLVSKEILEIPKNGCIGFHPTRLPLGRGRAPIAWLALDSVNQSYGAATFFVLTENPDEGGILAQQPFDVSTEDYAEKIIERVEGAMRLALNRWLPELKSGIWNPAEQNHALATFNGKRGPNDSHIDWSLDATQIVCLVRAASKPHPGAYTYLGFQKIFIWKAHLDFNSKHRGVVGRILQKNAEGALLVQCGIGLIWLTDFEFEQGASSGNWTQKMSVGTRLGYGLEDEIFTLKHLILSLESRIASIESNYGK